MIIEELREKMLNAAMLPDAEQRHIELDKALLEYVNDEIVTDIHNSAQIYFA